MKIYSSVKPELVPAIVDEAGKRGLRVGGHIPAGMTAERAVRAGYDEIQHMNMLFLNFMFDRVPDTRTPARLTAVAGRGRRPRLRRREDEGLRRAARIEAHHRRPDAAAVREPDRRSRREDGDRVCADRGPAAAHRAPRPARGRVAGDARKGAALPGFLRRDAPHADRAARGGRADRRRHGFARWLRADARARALREGGHPGARGAAHGDARRRARRRAGRAARLDRARQARRLHPRGRRSERGSRRAAQPAPRREGRRAARAGRDVARARHPAAAQRRPRSAG